MKAAPTADAPANGWRTFLWLWGSQALSVLGGGLSGFALNIYLTQTRFPLDTQRAELAAALSLTALGWTFAALLGAPLAGALADRWDRRRMMLTCDLLGALVLAGGVALVTLTTPPVWALVAFTATLGLIGTFHGSAFDTSYAVLVPRAQLPRANGMMQTIWSLSGLLSPALAALLIGLPALARSGGGPAWLAGIGDGVPLAFALDGATFLLAALVISRLRIPTPPRRDLPGGETGPRPSLGQDMRFGWRFIFARPPLLHLLLTFAAVNLLTSGVGVLHPLLVRFALLPDAAARGLSQGAALATLWTAFSAGGLAGGLLVSTWGGLKRRRVLGVLVPMVLAGAAHAASGVLGALVPVCIAVACFGLMTPVMNAHSQAIWQSQVPPDMQGRVFSVRRLIAQFTAPVSTALAGLLAARTAPGSLLLWSGLILVLVAGVQLLNPVIRRVDSPLTPAPVLGAEVGD
ncbi:Major facilitator superfamily MFS 1 [Deinococcus phoenicis]|uniref:Major facilitator superfamily MFS 1 n=1 Tax=Deinococcus phoenicis TaxID=1476583 RepID=A0A016QNV4_9DEIO|nr:MFS transporter [Deinococcus phoenicis]EYB67835.1 Major facilitator superfamily MFS 1 [Deinococcus phoenicis]